MKTVTLHNDFHGRSVNVRLRDGQKTLSRRQMRRVVLTLCCSDCLCTLVNSITNAHGEYLDFSWTRDSDGSAWEFDTFAIEAE